MAAPETPPEAVLSRTIETPLKVVFAGGILTALESMFVLLYPGAYTGEISGVEITTSDVFLFTTFGLVLVVVALAYAYSVRYEPSRKMYLVVGGFGLVSFLFGFQFLPILVVVGAMAGYWRQRKKSGADAAQ